MNLDHIDHQDLLAFQNKQTSIAPVKPPTFGGEFESFYALMKKKLEILHEKFLESNEFTMSFLDGMMTLSFHVGNTSQRVRRHVNYDAYDVITCLRDKSIMKSHGRDSIDFADDNPKTIKITHYVDNEPLTFMCCLDEFVECFMACKLMAELEELMHSEDALLLQGVLSNIEATKAQEAQ